MKYLLSLFRIFILPMLAVPAIGAGEAELMDEETELPAEASTPFKTMLRLTPEALEKLTTRALQRIEEMMDESGLSYGGQCQSGGFMDKRVRNQMVYDGDMEFRKTLYGGIFLKSNLTRGVTKRFAREMSAKVSDDMLGTTPFFAATKRIVGQDASLARGVEEFCQVQIERSNVPPMLREAQRTALIRNEAVVKVRHFEDVTFFVGPATVLVGEDGQPVMTGGGEFIYQDDDFAPDQSVDGLLRLKKDPTFTMTEGQFGLVAFPDLRQPVTRKSGLEAHVLDCRSFLCPLTAPCIHKADIVVQFMDMTIEQVRATYGQYESGANYCQEAASGESQPRATQGEKDGGSDSNIIKTVQVAECYMRADADGDDIEEEIFVVIDRTARKAIFYDYLDSHFHKRPFEVIVGVESEPNRWYGTGIIQMLWDQNIYTDMMFNRINVKDSRESSATFIDEMACKEWKGNGPVELGTDEVIRIEPGYDPKNRPPIWRANLNEVSEFGERLMQTAVQDMTTSFGVISAKDASTTNLNNSRTATGIINMERTANTLTRYTEQAQQVGIEAILKQCVVIALENMPPMAMFWSIDGKELLSLNKTEARSIEKDVRLFLTRSRSTESLTMNTEVARIVNEYWNFYETSPRRLQFTRANYLRQLKSLECPDADEMLPIVDDAYIQQWQDQQAKAAEAAKETDNDPREMLSYKDAPPSIQEQMEQKAGYEPANEAERAKMKKDETTPKQSPKPKKGGK